VIGGQAYPLEMHMVHINSKYVNDDGTLDSAFATNADGAAVLGFMLSVPSGTQEDYAPLENVITGIATVSTQDVGTKLDEVHLNLAEFRDSVMAGGYFSYLGSLTTPACNEVVTWTVLEKTVSMSEAQVIL
jgi:carbonic anhydrase